MDIDELKRLYYIAKNLGDGKDPITQLRFEQDTILNSNMILQYNIRIAEILDDIIAIAEKTKQPIDVRKRKLDFYLGEEEKQLIKISKSPISISALVYAINSIVGNHMKKLHAVDITSWMLNHGYLELREMGNGNKYKVATSDGNEFGIINEVRQNLYGNLYSVNLYNESAQRYIVDHINEILYGS